MKVTLANTFAAAGTQRNILAGTNLEYAPFTGKIRLGATLSASTGSLSAFAGSDQFIDQAYIPPVNRVPLLPEDFMVIDEVFIAQGEQIKIDISVNGACTSLTSVELTPIE